jgi:hypothetical protein
VGIDVSGGGGGGAGGIIFLDAPIVSVDGGCLSVLGGLGGEGGQIAKGRNPTQKPDCPFNGEPYLPSPGEGGGGGVPGIGTGPGMPGGVMGGGGGGLGSYGRVIVRSKMQPSTLPDDIVAPKQSDAFNFMMLPP